MAEAESETILGKMVKEALLGGIRVKTGIKIDNQAKCARKALQAQTRNRIILGPYRTI